MPDDAKVGLEPSTGTPETPAEVAEAPKKRGPFAAEIEALEAVESSLAKAFEAYARVNARRSDGHADHAAHRSVGDLARREIGKAHGGAVTALEALRLFAIHHEKADALHGEAEEKLEFTGDYSKNEGRFPTRDEAERAWAEKKSAAEAAKKEKAK